MAPSIWELFVVLLSREKPDDDEAGTEDDERRFVPSPLDLSVRVGDGGTEGERLRELSKIDERAREIEGASHGLMLERSESFTEVLREFLADAFAERGAVATAGETED